ncbi:hypothetical protein HKCCE4037_01705 [Rhodobacterales bacterium HKCCE4037]|nr:hypothetical protein [Rhodobacterales bacterium HKCCE4037]
MRCMLQSFRVLKSALVVMAAAALWAGTAEAQVNCPAISGIVDRGTNFNEDGFYVRRDLSACVAFSDLDTGLGADDAYVVFLGADDTFGYSIDYSRANVIRGSDLVSEFSCTGLNAPSAAGSFARIAASRTAVFNTTCTITANLSNGVGVSHSFAVSGSNASGTATINLSASTPQFTFPDTGVTLSGLNGRLGLAGDRFSIGFDQTFGQSVTGLEPGDFAVTNGTVSDIQGSGTSFTALLTPSGDGTVSVSLNANSVTFGGTGSNAASNILNASGDVTRPTPLISALPTAIGLTSTSVTVDFGEPVSGFELGDLTLTNLGASGLSDLGGGSYAFDVVATGTGTGRLSIAAGAVRDGAGNDSAASAEVTADVSNARPNVIVSRFWENTALPPDERQVILEVQLNDAKVQFSGDPLVGSVLTNATLEHQYIQGANGTFTIRFRVTGGPVTLTIAENALSDQIYGNSNEEIVIDLGTYDVTAPTPVIAYANYDRIDPFTATIDFGEEVTGFELSDITPTFAELSGFTDLGGGVFSVTVTGYDLRTPPEISVPADVTQDLSGNNNLASPAAVIPAPDGDAPSVVISGIPDGFTGPVTADLTFDWGEGVVDFSASDISVAGGTLGPLVAVGTEQQVWRAELTVTGDRDVTISIPADAVLDGSGTGSAAAFAIGAFASGTVAEAVIRDFLGARGQALIASQPALGGLLDNDGPSGNIQVTRGQGIVQIQTGTEGPIWAALDSSWSDINGFETAYTLLTFGSHVYLADETLLGVMVQFDHAASTEGVAEIEGTGWLIGPYYVARYGGVVVDARVLWGQTDNEIRPTGTYTDHFGTERVLAMLNLSGEIELERATLRPLLGWAYTEDRSEAYVDALSNPVSAQRVRLSEVETGLDWVMPIGAGAVDFTGGMSAIFTAEEGGNEDLEGGRGRVDLGLSSAGTGPLSFDLGVYVDGLFRETQERYGANVSVDWRF